MDQSPAPGNGASHPAVTKPKLNLKMPAGSTAGPAAAPAAPSATPGTASGTKIKINLGKLKSTPATPANEIPQPKYDPERPPAPPPPAPAPIKTKSGRVMKPSAKKRAKDVSMSDDDDEDGPAVASQFKRIKLHKTPTTPGGLKGVKLRFKNKGHPPFHPPGDGYNSELEDREEDPVIEEQFIVRFAGVSDMDLEYMTQMIEEGRVGEPFGPLNKEKSPAQFGLKWLQDRRALVRIRTNMYAAVLLDLPTITESMKTWDKRNVMKTADICQMLLVYAKVGSEAEAKTAALPRIVGTGGEHRWPHGLTPPLHDVMQRRFRKRLTKKEVKDKEAELARLLAMDASSSSTRYELVTIGQDGKEQFGEDEEEEHDDEQDAEGEFDDEEPDAQVAGEDDLFADEMFGELEKEIENHFQASPGATATPMEVDGGDGTTPAAASDSGGDEDEDDDEEEVDEDAEGEAADQDDTNEAIAEAQRTVAKLEDDLAKQTNRLLIQRIETQLKNARKVLNELLAKRAEGREDDDEEEEDDGEEEEEE